MGKAGQAPGHRHAGSRQASTIWAVVSLSLAARPIDDLPARGLVPGRCMLRLGAGAREPVPTRGGDEPPFTGKGHPRPGEGSLAHTPE